LLVGLAGGLLGMAIPLATGVLLGAVIPTGQSALLVELAAGLLVAALATALFSLIGALAVLRLSAGLGATEAALFDRMLDLPLPFFRDYTAGDLAQRMLGLEVLREILTSSATSILLAAVFSVSGLAVLFAFDRGLALAACGLVLVLMLALGTAGILQIRWQRVLGQLAGSVAGTTLQLVNGVAKLRVAGAQTRAFAVWADTFSEQRRVAYQARRVDDHLATFTAAFPVVASLVLFGIVALELQNPPSLAAFLAFNVAFGQVVGALLALADVVPSLSRVVPTYERARPVLQAQLENRTGQSEPGELSGDIAIDRASFRYTPGGPLVLDDISLRFRPGEFVAVVGPSGSGKSTLLRLLLGFEAPESGGIFYDGTDLATLDLRAVRREVGSVLQTGRLTTGDIFSNIVGASMLSLDDAWEAARVAQLAADIEAMPMGMYTPIGEGGSMLSGGQRQRLLIARAVVRRPRIIFFDEATSALDNRTQELVSRSLQELAATRVIVAHRLSTIINADRIYVLNHGRIVESGSYRELIQQRGVFADLARRQIG
jgi:ATP-binding cassette subfamily C protein